jgi:hypothetical protein
MRRRGGGLRRASPASPHPAPLPRRCAPSPRPAAQRNARRDATWKAAAGARLPSLHGGVHPSPPRPRPPSPPSRPAQAQARAVRTSGLGDEAGTARRVWAGAAAAAAACHRGDLGGGTGLEGQPPPPRPAPKERVRGPCGRAVGGGRGGQAGVGGPLTASQCARAIIETKTQTLGIPNLRRLSA